MKRVVVTGIGVVAPNGKNIQEFEQAIRAGQSGIRFQERLKELKFRCQVAGVPEMEEYKLKEYFSAAVFDIIQSLSIKYACLATLEAFEDAGLTIPTEEADWDLGTAYGQCMADFVVTHDVTDYVDAGRGKRMGSKYIWQAMNSGPTAMITQLFGTGNRAICNASACSTGTESVVMAYERIKSGKAKRMIAGASESANMYTWGSFDAMRVLSAKYNDTPEAACRPMSASSNGFAPGGGAGTLILEDLESALDRGAKIYCEMLGGDYNSGGQRSGGTMTAPNTQGVRRCIKSAVEDANIKSEEIDYISGHLTATMADKIEVGNWVAALGLSKSDFPYINSTKSMTGHCIGAAGAIECVSAILQLTNNFVHPSINCEDLNPEIEEMIGEDSVPRSLLETELNTVISGNFGFGDVNSCAIFRKYEA